MIVVTKSRHVDDEYYRLVESYPLVRIAGAKHLAEAMGVIDLLLARRRLSKGAQAYLDALSDLVESYENEHEIIPDASDSDILRFLMESNGYSQPKVAELAGISQSTISSILAGKRQMTRGHVVRFARVFNVSPAAFLPTACNTDKTV